MPGVGISSQSFREVLEAVVLDATLCALKLSYADLPSDWMPVVCRQKAGRVQGSFTGSGAGCSALYPQTIFCQQTRSNCLILCRQKQPQFQGSLGGSGAGCSAATDACSAGGRRPNAPLCPQAAGGPAGQSAHLGQTASAVSPIII